ncbi:dTMP kinase [Andreprevotia lacus DSM 23236]|jgi:dTMP kinase|uniref:Thymidylate kinase n=1 Tax=Andreprevotia lacus DSM 23236 TaxID=1121001 RepID=A0A1W1X7G6_9NEIS|nr:dTMP kinase [Andreprevotia lacus]SMC19461.1 dTMP kinase [Andreprevotia lacus DSM 23236]
MSAQISQGPQGRFISVEGVDGAGKSTQLAWLADWLSGQGIRFVSTREPGGTPLGEKLRALLLNEPMHLETEALLMFASRREHLAQVVEPALARGDWVLCDRFSDATYAYQGGGRGLDLAKFAALETLVQQRGDGLLQPHLTLLFDVPPEVSAARMANGRELDRFEREAADFHTRVRDAYLRRAAADPARIKVIDANRGIATIQAELTACLPEWLAA